MPDTYRVEDVDAAIDLASRFKQEGRYDWFRGQVRAEWLPHTSLMRLQLKDPNWEAASMPRFARFFHWLKHTPGLSHLSEDTDSLFAIAQHYGLPTHYLDFTTDPAVAGFFAADTDTPEPGVESCILCLNSADLLDVWGTIGDAIGEAQEGSLAEIQLVRVNVDNLWRLEAQSGVFLYAPTNWDFHYPMDRILFPYRGYPSYPTKRDVYPDRKSQLELLLDQFFDNERKIEGNRWLRQMFEELQKKNPHAAWTESAAHPLGYDSSVVCGGTLPPHRSWGDIAQWLAVPAESHRDVLRREVPIRIDAAAPAADVASRFSNGVRRAMERDSTLRKHSVTWKVEGPQAASVRPSRDAGLVTLWDGLRRLPIDDSQLARALGNWVGLYQLDFDIKVDAAEKVGAYAHLLGPSLRVEFGTPDGASAIGQVTISGLRNALRDDLPTLLVEDVRDRLGDLEFLLRAITSPQRLFDFTRLATLFATEIAPSQMTRTAPHFFHPARLSVFGLP